MKLATVRLSILFLFTVTCLQAQVPSLYLDPSQPVEVRARDLVSKMTLDEKVFQLMNESPAIERLGVPAYDWWNECLHGVARSGVATVFPQAIGLGATFDPDLVHRMGNAISDEARAMYNAFMENGYHLRFGGLTFWTPNINIFRDPRWGRGQETYGEDPYLTSLLGVELVKGLQGNDPKYLKVAACAKHFAVHSGPERLRHEFNAKPTDKDLYETYLPAFKALVDAKVEAVMCAYNRTNDQPCCSNNYLLTDVLRNKWGFKGHVVSDCGSIADFYEGHKVTTNVEGASAMALQHGVNLNCGVEYAALVDAVKKGVVDEKLIDNTLVTLLQTRFRLGMFDPKGKCPYDNIRADVINSAEHRQLAREAALKSMVLLKNNGVLPLKNNLPRYYVTGPNATSIEVLLGNYYGVNNNLVTILEGLASKVRPGSQLQYKPGCLLDRDNINPIDWTTSEVKASDATIVVLGLSGYLEGEEGESLASSHFGDRLDYNLPRNQIDFLRKLRQNTTKPIIVVVTGGSPMNLAEVHELADAVLLAWYPGEEGGNAVADILFGDASPSGKLPVTFPRSFDQLPAYDDYNMKGRTYRYMTAEPLYPFGFGLSYAHFEYSNLQISSAKVKKGTPVSVEVTVTNTGKYAGDEIVQLYITKAGDNNPLYSLKSVQRITLKPGASTNVKFQLTPEALSVVDEKGEVVLSAGDFIISVGGCLPGKRSEELGMSKILQTKLNLM
jgi:beta-glucosidase